MIFVEIAVKFIGKEIAEIISSGFRVENPVDPLSSLLFMLRGGF